MRRKKHARVGGSVINFVIALFIIFLVINAAYYYLRGLDRAFSSGNDSAVSGTITTGTSTTGSLTYSATTASSDNMSLAQLGSLSFANSSECGGFLDPRWGDTAIQTSGKTVVTIIPNTVYSLPQSYNGWATYFRDNTTNAGLDRYTFAFMTRLAAQVMGTHDMTKAAAVVRNYTSSVAGLEATGADFLTFGGLSALRVYSDTGNVTQAAGATFPAQIYQLFLLSQDCSYSEEQRAQFFGTAMSMSLFILATSGKDGFGPKFDGLLVKLGLRDAWAGMKGYVKEIMDTSPAAAYRTTLVLSAVVKKFPNAKLADLASFTSSRIANMVKVLKDKGLSPDEIAQKVAELTKAVEESGDEGHVAEIADKISYEYEEFLRVKIDSDRIAALFSQAGRRHITASFLANILPGFKVGEVTALKITVHKLWMELPSYHMYQGGKYVEFVLPKEEVQPGDAVGLSFELLPVEDFAKSIPAFALTGPKLKWLSDGAVLKDFKLVDGVLEFTVLQKNQWSSVQEFTIKGEIVKYPGESNQYGGIYAEFSITDYAGRIRDLRLRFDGFRSEGLLLVKGDGSRTVSLVSYDDFRLSIVYGSDNQVATIYLEPPSESIYSLGTIHRYSGSYLKLVQGKYTQAFQIDNVQMLRDLEKEMLDSGSTYSHGRLGAEISYVVGDKVLGLKSIIIEEPSKGGRDLHTEDNTVAIQTRFLQEFEGDRETIIQKALLDLADKLQEDYQNQRQMRDGYAILSYLDSDGTVKTIILEVPKW